MQDHVYLLFFDISKAMGIGGIKYRGLFQEEVKLQS